MAKFFALSLLVLLAVAQFAHSADDYKKKDKYSEDTDEYGKPKKTTTTTSTTTTTTKATTTTTTGGSTTPPTPTTTPKPTTTTCPPVTPKPKDVCLVLDGSGSITAPLFNNQVLNFGKKLAKMLNIAPAGNNLAVVQFANAVRLEFGFTDAKSVKEAEAKIGAIKYMNLGTFTGRALAFTANTVLPKARPNAEKLVIVLTDGDSSDAVVAPANALRAKGATVLAIGVGKGIKQKTLDEIAGGKKENTFAIDKFDALEKLLEEKIKVC